MQTNCRGSLLFVAIACPKSYYIHNNSTTNYGDSEFEETIDLNVSSRNQSNPQVQVDFAETERKCEKRKHERADSTKKERRKKKHMPWWS